VTTFLLTGRDCKLLSSRFRSGARYWRRMRDSGADVPAGIPAAQVLEG
jgi:hypothetical protein